MTTNQINLIRTSWKMAAAGDPEVVGALFYGRLFRLAPETESLFSDASITEQTGNLISILSYVISKLDRLDDIAMEVVIAKRYAGYGLNEEHYTAVGLALIWSLKRALADDWNDETQEAWLHCYNTLSSAVA